MIVKYSSLCDLEVPKFTLCNPGSVYNDGLLSKVVGMLIDHEAEEIVFNFNAISELNLRVNRVIRNDNEENSHAYYIYKAIQNRRLIFVEDIGYFMITNINDGYDGHTHYKDITAKSIDAEIAQKMVPFIADGTYKFVSDVSDTDKGIFEMIVETLPLWTIGEIDETVAAKWRTFENIDTSLNCLSFLLENIQDAYECIIIFDCINRVINVYAQDNYIVQTDIHITKNDLVNSLNITENADDLYTAVSVLGDDNVTISAINPLGSNTIYNFNHYLGWMSDSLSNKVAAWQDEVEAVREQYYNLNLQYYDNLTTESNLQLEIERLANQIKIYSRCRDNIVAESSTDLVDSYNTVIIDNGGTAIEVYAEIANTLAEIDDLIAACESRQANTLASLENINNLLHTLQLDIAEIQDELSITTYFSAEEQNELLHYIYEGSYHDDYVVITDIMSYEEKFEQMKTLYDRADLRLQRVSSPTQEFNIDVENFIFAKDFEHWSEQLETGCLINVELETNDIAYLFLSNITINYDDRSLNMTFGNRFNKFDPKSLFNDILGDVSKSANTLNYIKEVLYPIKSGEFSSMKEALQTSRNLSMGAAISSSSEEVLIDGSGYTGRKLLDTGFYDPRQVKLTGKSLVFTDDAWETCKVAIGELLFGDGDSAYGINAQTIIGDIIVGNNIRIIDKDGNDVFTVVDDKIEATVGYVDNKLTQIEQTSSELSVRIESLENAEIEVDHVTTTTGYTFDTDGLQIYKSGNEMKNLLDNTGMYVTRSDEEILTANNEGVIAINLTSKQYLIVGTNSRFENYSNGDNAKRTACFYIGG